MQYDMQCIRIGYGQGALLHEQKLERLGVKTVGIIETDPTKKLQIISNGFFCCKTYEEAAKLKPHFWDICTPTDDRFSIVSEILKFDPKANILMENPVCSIEQVPQFETLEKSGVNIVVNENYLSSKIAEEVKKKAFDELKLKPTNVIVEFDKTRIDDFKKGRFKDRRGAFGYEGTHMITCLQSLGSEFLPTEKIVKKYEDLYLPEKLENQGSADITYKVNGVSVNLFSSMKGDIKHSFPPYGRKAILENETGLRYRILAVEGIDPKGNQATVVGFYEPIQQLVDQFKKRSQGAIAVIREEKVVDLQTPIEADSMGDHLAKVVSYFKGQEKVNPCSLKEGIQAVLILDSMLM